MKNNIIASIINNIMKKLILRIGSKSNIIFYKNNNNFNIKGSI